MLVFDHLNSSLPAKFDDLFIPFKEQYSHNTRRAREICFKYPKNQNLFLWFQMTRVQIKSIKDWNNIIDKIHFTTLKIS